MRADYWSRTTYLFRLHTYYAKANYQIYILFFNKYRFWLYSILYMSVYMQNISFRLYMKYWFFKMKMQLFNDKTGAFPFHMLYWPTRAAFLALCTSHQYRWGTWDGCLHNFSWRVFRFSYFFSNLVFILTNN